MHLLYNFGATLLLLDGAIISGPLILMLCLSNLGWMTPSRERRTTGPGKLIRGTIILVPAHNEELVLSRTLQSLARAIADTDARVLVIAHNSTDETFAIASAAGVLVEDLRETRGGKGHALAHGFQRAFEHYKADSVLVIDADSVVTSNAVSAALAALRLHPVIQLRYGIRGGNGSPAVQVRKFAFHCMNHVRPLGRRRLAISAGILGNGFGLRHEVFRRVPYSAHSIVEDVELHLSLVEQGFSSHYVTEAAVYGDVLSDKTAVGVQAARWEGGRLRLLRAQGPRLLRNVLGGQVRLLEPLLDLAALPIGFVASTLLTLLLLPSSVTRLYAGLCFSVLAIHVTIGVLLCDEELIKLSSIVYLPVYVLRKLAMVPRIRRVAYGDAPWQPTQRSQTTVVGKPEPADWSRGTYVNHVRKLVRSKEASHARER